MLETLRQYARERLDESDDADAWRRRHAAHYAAFAEGVAPGLVGRDELSTRRRISLELDNLRAAVTWALDSPSPDDTELGIGIVARLGIEASGRGGERYRRLGGARCHTSSSRRPHAAEGRCENAGLLRETAGFERIFERWRRPDGGASDNHPRPAARAGPGTRTRKMPWQCRPAAHLNGVPMGRRRCARPVVRGWAEARPTAPGARPIYLNRPGGLGWPRRQGLETQRRVRTSSPAPR